MRVTMYVREGGKSQGKSVILEDQAKPWWGAKEREVWSKQMTDQTGQKRLEDKEL